MINIGTKAVDTDDDREAYIFIFYTPEGEETEVMPAPSVYTYPTILEAMAQGRKKLQRHYQRRENNVVNIKCKSQ